MKRAIAMILCVVLLAGGLFACKKAETQTVSMYDLSRAMLAATDFDEMTYVSSADTDPANLLSYASDIDYDLVDAFFMAFAKDGKGNADELCVIALKDAANAAAAEASLKQHLEKRISLYATYDPTQSKKVENGLVFSQGQYAVFIVSNDNAAVKTAFTTFLSDQK